MMKYVLEYGYLLLALLLGSFLWSALRISGGTYLNGPIDWDLLIYGLSSDLVWTTTKYAFFASAGLFLPTHVFLSKESIPSSVEALAFVWLGIGLGGLYFVIYERLHLFGEKAVLWVLVNVGPAAVAGFFAWSIFALAWHTTRRVRTASPAG